MKDGALQGKGSACFYLNFKPADTVADTSLLHVVSNAKFEFAGQW